MDNLSFSEIGDVDLDLPDAECGRVWRYVNPGWRYPMHHHRELELALTLRGTGSYLLGGRRYTLRPHSLVWLFPGQDHILLEESPDYAMWQAVFKPEALQGACRTPATAPLLQSNPEGHFCKQLSAHEAERLTAMFQDLNRSHSQTDYFNAGLLFLLMSAWSSYLAAGQTFPARRLHPAVEKAARILSEESAPLTLEAIASEVGLCSARLSYLFREEIGVSLLQFRDKQRLERFLYLAQKTERPNLLEIALEAGFGSYAQFHRIFTRVYGRPPSKGIK